MSSRSLGTLTLDLVLKNGGFETAIDKTARTTKDKTGAISSDLSKIGLGVAAAGAAAATAAVVWTKNMAQMGQDVTKLAQVAGVSAEQFQELAYAAKSVGIEQDKLGDIFKDVQDKVGEFLQTGGGPLADFFEKIGPKVGVTAKQFKGLSGPEALGLYVSSLEKAGASQAEMTFYLEAIANDATVLLPLLKNNAQGFKDLGAAAQRFGAILSDDAIKAGTDLQRNLQQLDALWDSVSVTLGNKVLPVMSMFVQNSIKAWTETSELKGAVDTLTNDTNLDGWIEATGTGLAVVADVAVGLAKTIYTVGQSFQAVAADVRVGLASLAQDKSGIADFFNPEEAKRRRDEFEAVVKERDEIVNKANTTLENLWTYQGDRFYQTIQKTFAQFREQQKAAASFVGPPAPMSSGRPAGIGNGTKPITSTSTDSFLAGIRAQIAEQDQLTQSLKSYGLQAEKVNAGDKLLLQLQQQLALAQADRSGKVSDATLKEAMSLAALLSARTRDNEQMQKSLELAASFAEYRKSLSLAEIELGDQLSDTASGWAKTAEAAQVAAAKSKIYRDAEKQIDAVLKAGLPGALAQVKAIEDTADAHAEVTSALMGRIQAEQGAQQLYEENRRFAADSILDETERAAAILKIDADNWRERIALVAEGTAERRKLEEQFDIWLRNQSQRPIIEMQRQARQQVIDDWVETIDGVGEVFREGFADMLNGGQDAWGAFTKSLATTFKTTVADAIYKSFVKPIIVNLVANAAGSLTGDTSIGNAVLKAAGGVSGGNSALGLGSSALNLFGTAGSNFAGGFSSGVAAFGNLGATVGNLQAGVTALQAGNIAGGLGSIAGTAGTYVGAAVTAYQLLSKLFDGGEKRAGGTFGLVNGQAQFLHGPSGGTAGQAAAVQQTIDATVGSINSMLQAVGSQATIAGYKAAFEQSERGRGGVLAGGVLSTGALFGEQGTGSNYKGTYYEKTSTQSPDIQTAVANLITDLKQSTIQALQAAVDIPQSLRALIDGVDAEALSDEQVTALLDTINTQIAAVGQFRQAVELMPFDQLQSLSYDAANALISLSGGLDSLVSGLSTYYQNFYSEAERFAFSLEQMQGAAEAVGITLPDTKEGFRSLVESLDLTTEGGQKAYTTLIGLSGSFAEWVNYMDSLAVAVDEAVQDVISPERVDEIVGAAITAAQNQLREAQQAANDAFTILSNAIQKRRDEIQTAFDLVAKSLQTGIDAAQASVSKLTALSSRLKSTLDALAQQFDPVQNRRSAQDQIAQALSAARLTGVLPTAADLENALSVIAQPSEGLFSTFEDYQLDFLKTANDIAALNKLTTGQLTTEEKTLKALQDSLEAAETQYQNQMAALDAQLETAQRQLEEAMGTRLAVLSVEDAITNLSAKIAVLAAAEAKVPVTPGKDILGNLDATEKAVYDAYSASGLQYLDSEGFKFWVDAIKAGASVAAVVQQITDINNAKNMLHGSHASGLWNVPFDGYRAELHAGETVLPADEARAYRMLQNAPDMDAPQMQMVSLQRQAVSELQALRALASAGNLDLKRTANILDANSAGGGPFLVEMVEA